ncbi:NTF2 fold immunity protein, partial [Escherichia coli]|uniref:NTF2 fold immunity protein n=1 Tax=Escherichia coli TaxID=562 RepID=UPI0020108C44
LMMSLWDALRMNMMISYQELVRTFLTEIYVRYRYGERIAEEEKPYLITELPDSWVVEGAKLPYEVAGGVFIIEINKKNGVMTPTY